MGLPQTLFLGSKQKSIGGNKLPGRMLTSEKKIPANRTRTATLCFQIIPESRYAHDDVLSEDIRKQGAEVS